MAMLRLFSALIGRFRRASEAELPIREELYSIERLEQFAVALAAEHKIAERPQRVSLLLPRLEENGRKLIAAYKALAESIREEHVISPAAEWLVDNFHIVEEQVREIREDLPKSYYHELPKLADGPFKNYPRIYAFSFALIAHTDSHLDTETLRRFINTYQKVSPLSIGELWRSEEHTSELQSRGHLVCRLLLEKKKSQRNSFGLFRSSAIYHHARAQ